MRTDQVQTHWDTAYASKPSDRHSWYQASPERSLGFIEQCGMEPSEPLIDVGGGESRLVDALLERGFDDLTVLDVSRAALSASRERLGERAGSVQWICTDIRDFQPARRYRLWHDRALFHFLTAAADRAQYVRALKSGLEAGGRFVVATFGIGGPERCSGLDIVQYDEQRMLEALGPGFELEASLQETHRTPAGGEQRFAWFVLKRT